MGLRGLKVEWREKDIAWLGDSSSPFLDEAFALELPWFFTIPPAFIIWNWLSTVVEIQTQVCKLCTILKRLF
jgi:hypothetical protein